MAIFEFFMSLEFSNFNFFYVVGTMSLLIIYIVFHSYYINEAIK